VEGVRVALQGELRQPTGTQDCGRGLYVAARYGLAGLPSLWLRHSAMIASGDTP
jgi:hypothetical protein